MVSGLAAIVTVGFIGGSGGIVKGLAIAHTATAAIAATKTTLRIWILLGVIIYYSLRVGTTTHTKSNPKGSFVHHKSNIAGIFFGVWRIPSIWRGFYVSNHYRFVVYSPICPYLLHLFALCGLSLCTRLAERFALTLPEYPFLPRSFELPFTPDALFAETLLIFIKRTLG